MNIKVMAKRYGLTAFLLISFLAAHHALAIEPYWKEYGIELKKLSPQELSLLEKTVNFMGAIKLDKLKVEESLYFRYTKFRELFGFNPNGEQLKVWLLTRIKSVTREESWTIALNRNKGHFILGKRFFRKSDMLERAYCLIHEARHSDGKGYLHVKCPAGYPFISAGTPEIDLQKVPACDNVTNGAYAFQAAFLYELFAYGIFEQEKVGLVYNSSIARILPR